MNCLFKMKYLNIRSLRWKREGQREYSEGRERLETLNIAGADRMPSVSLSTDTLQLLPKSPVGSWQVCHSLWPERPTHSRPEETVQTHSSWPAPCRKLDTHVITGHITPQRGPSSRSHWPGRLCQVWSVSAIGEGKYSPAHQLNNRDLWELGLPAGVSASDGRKSQSAPV